LRLGWSHGDDEIITRAQSIEWFDLEHIGKSPARFDLQKLAHLNAHYMKESDASDLIQLLERDFYKQSFNEESIRRLTSGMNGLVQRSKTLEELYALSAIYTESPSSFTEKAQKAIDDGRQWLGEVVPILDALDNWCIDTLEVALKSYAQEKDVKLGKLMGAVRGAVTGRDVAPSMFEVMCILRKDSVVGRIKACL
jgi:glutamyl-tRNA synthetase